MKALPRFIVGWRVMCKVVDDDGGEVITPATRIYNVKSAAEEIAALFCKQGKDAYIQAVERTEGGRRRPPPSII